MTGELPCRPVPPTKLFSYGPAVIRFMSLSEDLVADDTNGERDVFVTVLP
jgi:hypothetical protein